MKTTGFWADVFERAAKTIAQTAAAGLIVAHGLADVNWMDVLSVSGLAGLLSVLTSIGSSASGDSESASLVNKKV